MKECWRRCYRRNRSRKFSCQSNMTRHTMLWLMWARSWSEP